MMVENHKPKDAKEIELPSINNYRTAQALRLTDIRTPDSLDILNQQEDQVDTQTGLLGKHKYETVQKPPKKPKQDRTPEIQLSLKKKGSKAKKVKKEDNIYENSLTDM